MTYRRDLTCLPGSWYNFAHIPYGGIGDTSVLGPVVQFPSALNSQVVPVRYGRRHRMALRRREVVNRIQDTAGCSLYLSHAKKLPRKSKKED